MKLNQEYKQLDYKERQTIAVCLELGLSIRAVARVLGRAPSTVSREINRNSGAGAYSCRFAQQRFVRRRRHSRPPPKLVAGNALFASVHALLQLRWSPQQIASRLATLHPHEAHQRVSHETIYNVIYA
ncbi:helix-turn-helix domain-containing protein, partial [Rhodoferax saidenbachensis]